MTRRVIEKSEFIDVTGQKLAVFRGRQEVGEWVQIRELESINRQLRFQMDAIEQSQDNAVALIDKLSEALNQALISLETGDRKASAIQAIRDVLGEA